MILVLGGAHSGRHDFCRSIGVAAADCRTVTAGDARDFAAEQALCPAFSSVCCRIASYRAVIATEQGLGIIPADAALRADREANGRLNVALASLADCVVIMVAGVARVIKGSRAGQEQADWQLLVFRHGATRANLERRYAGCLTDEDLCAQGREQVTRGRERLAAFAREVSPAVRAQMLSPRVVYVSPLRRAVQTAALLFPQAEQRVVADLREMDFGLFENRTADELCADPATGAAYRAFLDGSVPCPPSAVSPGERVADFRARQAAAFAHIVRDQAAADGGTHLVTVVAHGGTQMALFSQFCPWQVGGAGIDPYYAWQTACGGFRWGRVAVDGVR